jgi:isopenicillin N synthase-like dioxygenase
MESKNSPSYSRLPAAIDFSSKEGGVVKPGTTEWDSVRHQVRQALEEYGFFEAINFKKFASYIGKAILDASKQAFDLPMQTKERNVVGKPFPGYVGDYPVIPLYECMTINDATTFSQIESFTNTYWPQGNPSFCQTLKQFTEQVLELDHTVRRMVMESLGVEKYLKDHLESTRYHLRLTKYKEPRTDNDTTQLGLLSHTDKDMISILYQNEVDGLEFQTKDGGDQWIKIKFSSPDSFFVISGDSLSAWTNGRLHSPYHRVMMTGNQDRYSVGLFSNTKGGFTVKAPEELVDEDHPLLFKPFDHLEFMDFYTSEAGLAVESPLKAYCGL